MSIEHLEETRPRVPEGAMVVTEEQLASMVAERVTESIDDVRAMLRREDVGWSLVKGAGDEDGGLTLKDLKEWSDKLRSSTIAAPWIKRGLGLRHSYVWQGGIKYAGLPKASAAGRGNASNHIKTPSNLTSFFGAKARREREGRLYYDGIAVWIGRNAKKTLESVPLSQIEDVLRHPENPGIIVGYLRKWKVYDFATGEHKPESAYYIVYGQEGLFTGIDTIRPTAGAEPVRIERSYTAFHQHANSLDGFAFGVPDALSAWIWNAIARDAYMDGSVVSKAMASIAFKATSKNKTGAQNISLKLRDTAHTPGSTAVMGGATDLSAMANAGKGYDFDTLRGMVAVVATALDVSVVHLTADPGASGSSYGSAQTLDLPTRLAMTSRRDEHCEVDVDVLRWMGADEPSARFDSLEDPVALYRRIQAEVLPWLHGVEGADVFQARITAALGLSEGELGNIPKGVLIPNNEASLPRKDVDSDGQPAASTGSPTQGRSNDGNGEDPVNSNDVRSDD